MKSEIGISHGVPFAASTVSVSFGGWLPRMGLAMSFGGLEAGNVSGPLIQEFMMNSNWYVKLVHMKRPMSTTSPLVRFAGSYGIWYGLARRMIRWYAAGDGADRKSVV